MWTVEMIRVFLDDLWTRFRKHVSNASAHHAPYTDAEVDVILAVHTAISNAHHDKYTDAEAVAAADASDKFVERNVENVVTGVTTLKRPTAGQVLKPHIQNSGMVFVCDPLFCLLESTGFTYTQSFAQVTFPKISLKGTDTERIIGYFKTEKYPGVNNSFMTLAVANTSGVITRIITFNYNNIDVKNLPIKNIKNHPHTALSGDSRDLEFKIGADSWYVEVRKTKA